MAGAVLLCSIAVGFVLKNRTPPSKILCKDCNIILISLDTLGADHLPCYGYGRDTAPHLCAFAHDNILFRRSYANATYTLPTHVSLFTGLLPTHHGITSVGTTKLPESVPFLFSILKEHGYSTIFVSDENNPHMPIDRVYYRGIDERLSLGNRPWTKAISLFTQRALQGEKTFLFIHSYFVHPPYTDEDTANLYTSDYFGWMYLRERDKIDISPDFITNTRIELAVDLKNRVHSGPAPYQHVFDQLVQFADNNDAARRVLLDNPKILDEYRDRYDPLIRLDPANEREMSYLKAIYDQRIHKLESEVLLELLNVYKQPEIRKNTILLIISDHGEEFGEHGFTSHSSLYNQNTDVVTIMAVPGVASRQIDTPVQTADFTPTILSLVGIPYSYRFDGMDITPLFFGAKVSDRILVAEREHELTLRYGKWKLFVAKNGGSYTPIALYDVLSDPRESKDMLFTNLSFAKMLIRMYQAQFSSGR